MSVIGQPPGQLAAVVRTADRIDCWIRRHVHATDFIPGDLWSAPQASRGSRVNGAAQRKLLPARDRRIGLLAIGQCLKDQYDAFAAPIPPHLAALVEQLETQR